MEKRKKIVLTYGTFDLLHDGHINILKRAKNLGDYLIVAISTDSFNALKHKTSYMSYEKRKIVVEAIKYVDEVIPEYTWDQKEHDVKKYNVDVVVMGGDWEGSEKFEYLREFCEVIYLPRTDGISSTMLREKLNEE